MRTKYLQFATLCALLATGCDKLPVGKFKESLGKLKESKESTGSAEIRDITEDEFDEFIAQRGKVVVIDFHAEWCGPCKVLGPRLEKVAAEFGDQVAVGKVDVDQAGRLAVRLGVSSIPDVRIYRGGVSVDRFIGARGESDIRTLLARETALIEPEEDDDEGGGKTAEGEPEPPIQPMTKDWLPPGIEKR